MIQDKMLCFFAAFIFLALTGLAAAEEDNLLYNGDFEVGSVGIDGWSSAIALIDSTDNGPTKPGSQCAKIFAGGDIWSGYICDARPGKAYTAYYDYKTIAGETGQQHAILSFRNSKNEYIGQTTTFVTDTGGNWVSQYPVTMVAPHGTASLVLSFAIDSENPITATIKVDNAVVFEDANLVGNPGFESGDFINWYHSENTTIVSDNGPSKPGQYAAELCPSEDIRTIEITAEAGSIFDVNWDYKVDAAADGWYWGTLRFWDAGNNEISQDNFGHDPCTVWQSRSFTSRSAPAGTHHVDVAFFTGTATVGCMRVDNISVVIQAVTEPPSVLDVNDSILHNPDFELGWEGWYNSGNADINDSDSHEYGSKCAQMVRTSTSDPIEDIRTPTYFVDPNDGFAVSFSYKTLPGTTGSARAYLRFFAWNTYIGQFQIVLAPTDGQWVTKKSCCIFPSLSTINKVDMWFIMHPAWGQMVGTVRVDNVTVVNTTANGDIECDCDVDYVDLGKFVSAWPAENLDPCAPEADLVIDDFESYADQAALDMVWDMNSASSENTGTGSLTLLTNPLDVYEGTRALRFDYNNTDPCSLNDSMWTDAHRLFDPPLDISKYDELRIRVKRHAGNSEEAVLYVNFYNTGLTENDIQLQNYLYWSEGSTYADPDQWVEWVTDLRPSANARYTMDFYGLPGLTDVRGMIIGCAGDSTHGEGAGTIDIDRIVLVDNHPECLGNPEDLNEDCKVDFYDYALLALRWLTAFEN